jgi:GMP synthase (glutamine-hydrolysing)
MTSDQRHQVVLILDFGSQYTQLIARRVRELGVYCEIVAHDVSVDEIISRDPIGLILSGGPQGVYEADAPRPDPRVYGSGFPILGICYGMQLAADYFGGGVESADTREYGRAEIEARGDGLLLEGLDERQIVWMSHGDRVASPPDGFEVTAASSTIPIAGMEDRNRAIFCIQFHPEVSHTPNGEQILRNFLLAGCGARADWSMTSYRDEAIQRIRQQVGDSRVLCALSGGVDSTVVAVLLQQAIGDQVVAVFVDNGVLRENEAATVLEALQDRLGLSVTAVDARDRFLDQLEGVEDPEQKRRVIGRVFVEVFEDQASNQKDIRFLAQGTLYPDVIESASVKGPSAVIKTHHNVGGLPERLGFELIEPLRWLFKDEVRRLGLELGIPGDLIGRHPFPGPGLAVRILGEVTADRVALLQSVDSVFIEELRKADYYDKVSQAFAVLLPVKSVGVMGDGRTYENVVALRSVSTQDFMTADWSPLPYELLGRMANRIVNEVPGVNRVVYDITSKPPGTIEWE